MRGQRYLQTEADVERAEESPQPKNEPLGNALERALTVPVTSDSCIFSSFDLSQSGARRVVSGFGRGRGVGSVSFLVEHQMRSEICDPPRIMGVCLHQGHLGRTETTASSQGRRPCGLTRRPCADASVVSPWFWSVSFRLCSDPLVDVSPSFFRRAFQTLTLFAERFNVEVERPDLWS